MEDFFDFSRMSFKGGEMLGRQPQKPDMSADYNCINSMPLTMAYVPMQAYGTMYNSDEGLCRGTIFPDLDKPFVGCKKNWGAY